MLSSCWQKGLPHKSLLSEGRTDVVGVYHDQLPLISKLRDLRPIPERAAPKGCG